MPAASQNSRGSPWPLGVLVEVGDDLAVQELLDRGAEGLVVLVVDARASWRQCYSRVTCVVASRDETYGDAAALLAGVLVAAAAAALACSWPDPGATAPSSRRADPASSTTRHATPSARPPSTDGTLPSRRPASAATAGLAGHPRAPRDRRPGTARCGRPRRRCATGAGRCPTRCRCCRVGATPPKVVSPAPARGGRAARRGSRAARSRATTSPGSGVTFWGFDAPAPHRRAARARPRGRRHRRGLPHALSGRRGSRRSRS